MIDKPLRGPAAVRTAMKSGRSLKSYYKRSDEGVGQKMELAGTRPTHAKAPLVRQVLLN